MRRVRHRFHAARHDALRVARFDRLGREHYGLEPRAADLVDGERRNRAGETGVDRGLSGRRLADAARSTFPMITSSTWAASTPARRTASRITTAPSPGAGSDDSPPR